MNILVLISLMTTEVEHFLYLLNFFFFRLFIALSFYCLRTPLYILGINALVYS